MILISTSEVTLSINPFNDASSPFVVKLHTVIYRDGTFDLKLKFDQQLSKHTSLNSLSHTQLRHSISSLLPWKVDK